MKIREAREIEREKCQNNIEIFRAELHVLSKKRDRMVIEASGDAGDQWTLKILLGDLKDIGKSLLKEVKRQKRLSTSTRMDREEIRSVFHQAEVLHLKEYVWRLKVHYRGEDHIFKCRYPDLFCKGRHVWPIRSRKGIPQNKKYHVPDYLVPYIWEEVVDPWTALERVSVDDIYDALFRDALDHKYIYSGLHELHGRRWIYGIGIMKDKIRIVTGQSTKNKIVCLELSSSMGLAKLRMNQSSDFFCGALPEKTIRIPISTRCGEPTIRRRKSTASTRRDYKPYEKIAWYWLMKCRETSIIDPDNQIPLEKMRDCYKKGDICHPM